MSRQFLYPVGAHSVEQVVGRLGAIQSKAPFATDVSISTRRSASRPGDVDAAFAEGLLIRTFAFRGGTFLMTPETASMYLALRASSRVWELPSWQEFYQLKPADWPAFREAVRDALADGPLTRQDLGSALTRDARYRHLGFVFSENNWTLIKPLMWLGDMSFGRSAGGRATFQRLSTNPYWHGLMDLDEAGMAAIEAYFSAYGPATAEHLQYWLGNGLSAARKSLRRWLERLGSRLVEVDIEGEVAFVLAEHVGDLTATMDAQVVRLLPTADQWVFGPGTADPHVTPPARRALVARGANTVVANGVVAGTWTLKADIVNVDWFAEAGPRPSGALIEEVARLSAILGRPLTAQI
jgi:hypothetical protein